MDTKIEFLVSNLCSKPLCLVIWYDAVNVSSRIDSSELENVSLVKNVNVGWIYGRDGNKIVLVHGASESGELDYFVIPTCCIIDIKEIKL